MWPRSGELGELAKALIHPIRPIRPSDPYRAVPDGAIQHPYKTLTIRT
jgi:hypothetical protein